MSWSIQAMGKGEAVARSVAEQSDKMGMMFQPEQNIKDTIVGIVLSACESQPEHGLIVKAYGAQWTDNGTVKSQSVRLEIDTITFAE